MSYSTSGLLQGVASVSADACVCTPAVRRRNGSSARQQQVTARRVFAHCAEGVTSKTNMAQQPRKFVEKMALLREKERQQSMAVEQVLREVRGVKVGARG